MKATKEEYVIVMDALNKRFKEKRERYRLINKGTVRTWNTQDRAIFFQDLYNNNREIYELQGWLHSIVRLVG